VLVSKPSDVEMRGAAERVEETFGQWLSLCERAERDAPERVAAEAAYQNALRAKNRLQARSIVTEPELA
jgi:hypothetical protein